MKSFSHHSTEILSFVATYLLPQINGIVSLVVSCIYSFIQTFVRLGKVISSV